jgi:hypothetical protein
MKPLRVLGHGSSERTVRWATEIHQKLVGALAPDNATQLDRYTLELHVVPKGKKLTDLPDFANLSGKQSFDSKKDRVRKWDDIEGAGGRVKNTPTGPVIYFAVSEIEVVRDDLVISGQDTGPLVLPRYGPDFLQTHETGHVIFDYALTPEQQATVRNLYDARMADNGATWLAPTDYTSANYEEYFANSVAAFFRTPYSIGGDPNYSPEWLRDHDPRMFDLLGRVFANAAVAPATRTGAPRSSATAAPPVAEWDTVRPEDIPDELKPQPPPAPPPESRPRWLVPLGIAVVLLLLAGLVVAIAAGGSDDSSKPTTAERTASGDGANQSETGAASDAAGSCALQTAMTLVGIDKVPGQYHQGNIRVDVRDAAGPVEGATVEIRTEKSDGTTTTAMGTSDASGVVVFGMRTTRFGPNRLVVTNVTRPGCSFDSAGSQASLSWQAEP